jgi:hypothetical protein
MRLSQTRNPEGVRVLRLLQVPITVLLPKGPKWMLCMLQLPTFGVRLPEETRRLDQQALQSTLT